MITLTNKDLISIYGGAIYCAPTYDLFMKVYKYITNWIIKKWF